MEENYLINKTHTRLAVGKLLSASQISGAMSISAISNTSCGGAGI
jgi:hypothetical protein